MADDEQDPFGFLIDNCRYSSSQDELLTQVQFAREDEIFSDDDISPVMENSRVSRRQLDETKKRHRGESTAVDSDSARAPNLGFEGERKLDEERRVKEPELKKSKVSPSVNAKKVEFGGDTEVMVMDVAVSEETNKEGDTEEEKLRQRKKKRELPRSMYESDWDVGRELGRNRRVEDGLKAATLGLEGNKQEEEIGNNGNGNVESGVKEASVDCKSKGVENGTNKCILDALRLFAGDKYGNDGGKVDFFETAKRCGMVFPRSRFVAEVEEDE